MQLPTDGSRYFFYGLLSIVLLGAFWIISPFIGVISLAFITAVMFQPLYLLFLKIFKANTTLASITSMLAVVLILVLPVLFVIQLTVAQLIQFSGDIRTYTKEHEVNLETIVGYVNDFIVTMPYFEDQITVEQARKSIEQTVNSGARVVLDQALRTGASTLDILTQIFVYLFLLFFFFPLHRKIPGMVAKISPLDDELDHMFMSKALAMAQSMIRGTLVIAIIQAALGGFMLYLAGAPYVMFWIVLMTFLGIIPVVGASTVLIPAGLFFMAIGNFVTGLLLLLVTVVFVSNIDSMLRPHLVSKEAELHPAFVLIGVLGGLKAFGLLGVIYGPVIMILLVTMLLVFENLQELPSRSNQSFSRPHRKK